jgi:putative restriction endonuclease
MTPDELMARLSGLRRAQIGGKRAPHKPLLLLWLFGRLASTGSALATYAEAAGPVSQLINDFGPSAKSPARGGSARPCRSCISSVTCGTFATTVARR